MSGGRRLQDLTYGIVGLGIMGGSLAKAIRENVLSISGATGRVLACNRSHHLCNGSCSGIKVKNPRLPQIIRNQIISDLGVKHFCPSGIILKERHHDRLKKNPERK